MTGRRRLYLGGIALAIVAVIGGAPAWGAVDARLAGDFRVVGKITDSNNGTEGRVKTRLYRFRSFCAADNPCRRVTLRREGPQNTHFNSTLRRKRPGFYKGTENSGRVICPDGRNGSQRVKFRFWITREQDGVATRIRGKARFEADCPGGDQFQKARLQGRRR